MEKRVGFIGFGEAALHYTLGLQGEGISTAGFMIYYPRRSQGGATVERARRVGVELTDDPKAFANRVELVLSMTTPGAAEEAARAVIPSLGAGHRYADMNSTSPRVKRSIAERAASRGISFADVVILDSVPNFQHRVHLAASGSGAEAIAAELTALGTPVRVLGSEPGIAAAFKMLRSVYMKGTALLLLETLIAAREAGIDEAIMEDFDRAFSSLSFEKRGDRWASGTAEHAGRRVQELDFVLETLQDLGVDAKLTRAARAVMADVAERRAGKVDGWRGALDALREVWVQSTVGGASR